METMKATEQLEVWAAAHPDRRVFFDSPRPTFTRANAQLETKKNVSAISGSKDRAAQQLIRVLKALGVA